jgi:hypothetical protein
MRDKMAPHDKLMLFSIAFGFSAILYGVAAALTKVHNEGPTLISDLRRQSRRASAAAACSAMSSMLLMIQFIAK